MHPLEIDEVLSSMKLAVDTREQPTDRLRQRLESSGLPWKRMKLNAGDYSCLFTMNGEEHDFSNRVAIERKMNIDELAMCFGKERKRFAREFERAKEAGTRIYLIVENGSWEHLYNHSYRSQLPPKTLIASINAFRARYGMELDFCKEETTGKMMRDILRYELREFLLRIGEEDAEGRGMDKDLQSTPEPLDMGTE